MKPLCVRCFPLTLGLWPCAGLTLWRRGSFEELTGAFGARFVMCSRVPKPLDSLFSMAMRECETLKTYSDRYWETYNEIDGDFEDVAVRTFKVGLPMELEWRKSLTMKPTLSMG